LNHHKETKNQFSVTGKMASQLIFTQDRAELIHAVLRAFQAEGQRMTRYLFTLLRYTIESHHHSAVHFGSPFPEGEEARTWSRMIEAFQWMTGTFASMPSQDDSSILEEDPFHETPALQVFAKVILQHEYGFPDIQEQLIRCGLSPRNLHQLSSVLRLCARTMLRFPRTINRPFWIRLGKQAIALQIASDVYANEKEKNQTARFMATMARHGLLPEEQEEQEPEEQEPEEPEEPVRVLVPDEDIQGPLAAFAHDPQNVHTAPAQTQASAAIHVLMDPALPGWEACYQTFEELYGSSMLSGKRLRAFRESLETDEPQEVAVYLDNAEPFLATITYAELFCAARALIASSAGDLQVQQMEDMIQQIKDGYCTTEMYRLEGMADFLCKWTGVLATDCTNLEFWMKHRFHHLLTEIRGVALEEPEKTEMWTRTDLWTEFSWDVYNTFDFGTLYGDLLRRVWTYACTQPNPIKKEIVTRLSEEVVDGRGMCPQGKMTRLANVLRGFHPALETVSVLSVKEQLQNRMAVIGTLPSAERRVAAEIVFAELGIMGTEQGPWLEAVLEA